LLKKVTRINKRSFEKERIELIENSRKITHESFFEKVNEVKIDFKRRTTMIIGEDETLSTKNPKLQMNLKICLRLYNINLVET
jgi:hypothetical protein